MMQDQKGKELAAEIIREYEQLAGERGNWEIHWREIAERIMPMHYPMFQTRGQPFSQGEKRNQQLVDSTGQVALRRFGAILDSLLTPRNQTWHRLMPDNDYLIKNRQVRLWFEDFNRALFKYRYAPKANFASQNQQNYISLGAYGTGSVLIDELQGEPGLRYRNIHLGEIYFAENHQGIVDKAYRKFPLTARQAIQKWGDRCPDRVKEVAKNQKSEQLFYFVHCVKPNEEVQYGKLDFRGMKFASFYVAMEGQVLLSQHGYRTFPYAISRYEQSPGEVYGRGPAMDVLPAIKTLNEQKKTVLRQGHRAVDPVLLAYDDGVVDQFYNRPGAINPGGVTADGRPLVHALPTGNLAIGKELMDDERQLINDSFLVNLFQILVETPTMTATEVLERTREKGILLAPTIGRQQSEYLGPLIEREADILSSLGLVPPMPQALLEAKGEYRIEYDSPLSRAQRAEEAAGLAHTLETALQVFNITQNPEIMDYFNWDEAVPAIADIQGVPQRWLRDLKDVQELRAQRSQQQQVQTAIQAAPGAAAMTKAVAQTRKGQA